MTASKIVLGAASGAAGGAVLDVGEVFSTFLYEGNSGTQTITNGIDLTEGGLVWTKDRDTAVYHALTDTERGGQYTLYSPVADAQVDRGNDFITSFNSNGYSIGADGLLNDTYSYVSWTFRKAPKFFDVVTYTGDGSSSNTISHNLGSIPGFVVVKRTNGTGDWHVAARQSNGSYIHGNASFPTALNLTSAGNSVTSTSGASDMSFTSTTFDAKKINGYNTNNGSGNLTNINGATYVAYLFAHNNSDGEFGPDSDQDIIKCGSVSTDGSGDATVDLGFELQWLMVKATNQNYNWEIYDQSRGFGVNGHKILIPNLANAEGTNTNAGNTQPTSTGFSIGGGYWGNNVDLIYMAIRRGPLAVPEDATKVFGLDATVNSSYPRFTAGFPVDMSITTTTSGDPKEVASRLTGGVYMRSNGTNAEQSSSNYVWDNMTGAYFNSKTNGLSWMWKRARGYFDVVATKAVSSNNGDVTHNLGVKPEMAWYKRRDGTDEWYVATALNGYLVLDKTNAANGTASGSWLDAVGGAIGGNDATATTINSGYKFVGNATYDMIIYLFASAPGVSKVGSYTGNGSSQNIDCGFSSGARFVLTKCASHTGAWHVFDSVRGIVSGNDPFLELNSTSAQDSNYDAVDPLSSGFTVSDNITNENGRTFIFYAIA